MEDNKPDIRFKIGQNEDFVFESLTEKNFFIRQDSSDGPLNEREIFQLYPGKFCYNWLTIYDEKVEENDYTKYDFKYLAEQDFIKLDLNRQPDPLYLVKWCDLEYDEVTS